MIAGEVAASNALERNSSRLADVPKSAKPNRDEASRPRYQISLPAASIRQP